MAQATQRSTPATGRSTVVGVFRAPEQARDAIEALKDAGFSPDAISILSPDRRAGRELAEETGTHAGEGAATGAVTGGILGGLGGWLVGIGALAIPGVGPFIAAGALATALGGAAIGAGVGAIAGALVGLGVPKEEAEYYEGEVKSGRTLVTVRADGRYAEAQRLLRLHGAYDIESREGATATGATAAATGRAAAEGERTVQLREEQLQARTQPVQSGEVTVGKEVVEERRTMDVPVSREEVTVERHPVERRPADRPIDERGETISVPVREERVEVEKRPVVTEEVEVGKRTVQEAQPVSGTVRREELRVEREGDVPVGGAGPAGPARTWAQVMPTYQQRWQQRSGTGGGRWEEVEPGYRYGWELRDDPRYRGRAWDQVEADARRDWATRHPETPWERARASVRDAWEDATT
jgi:uncharacterized protein (TIGR02271 family)